MVVLEALFDRYMYAVYSQSIRIVSGQVVSGQL